MITLVVSRQKKQKKSKLFWNLTEKYIWIFSMIPISISSPHRKFDKNWKLNSTKGRGNARTKVKLFLKTFVTPPISCWRIFSSILYSSSPHLTSHVSQSIFVTAEKKIKKKFKRNKKIKKCIFEAFLYLTARRQNGQTATYGKNENQKIC